MLKPVTQMVTSLTDSYQAMSLRAAETVADQLRRKPDSSLGLPTGKTPRGCYEILSRWSDEGKLDWSRAHCFALDEYVGCEEAHSFAHYLEDNLYRRTNLPREHRFNPIEFDDYERIIALSGGLDLTIVGIGSNGHIAFNEPGTPRKSWTHGVWLTESTRMANAPTFGSIDRVPYKAITIGLETIMSSRAVLLFASGEGKHPILERSLTGQVGEEVPASFLQEHSNLTVLTDFEYRHR